MLGHEYINYFAIGIFSAVTIMLFNLINEVQHEPYLDEVFHIPQAQKYCSGMFYEWDPKITTLPGLYLVSVGALTPLTALMGCDMCSLYFLRFVNVVGSIANFYVLYCIQTKLYPSRKELNLVSTLNLATFPVLYFFTFLYYTDVLSTLLVMLMYLLHLHERRLLSAATGLLAVVTRQTNIIWVGFVLLETVAKVLTRSAERRGRKTAGSDDGVLHHLKFLAEAVSSAWKDSSFAALVKDLIRETVFTCAVCAGFLCFVAWNKGIVVGDKTAHQAVLHFPQLCYFSLFSLFFGFPFLLADAGSVFSRLRTRKVQTASLLAVTLIVIHFNTHVHPYLLADNRHYTFYVWKRVYERHLLARYLLAPVYLFAVSASLGALADGSATVRLPFALCVVLSLVPQKLLEFRYFILPYLLLRLHVSRLSWWQLLLEFAVYSAVNAATIYMFVTRTFTWPDSDQLHRFMW
ncbi:putative Dol-P-Glc:Glc(2)Man(9)GlcNAc(2)-PP-Dol alpha-1,2-glucosyltransferase [Bacillus rossius redtenbacheri]|uniref:putative Dol-P-Glc:Glc(2)Man(9)GlcNAc(2)-PP-Dol alpha-1,2-glucosyltransferase n=1 Tax=Bacillus rossius redtenbacheri TaxID=93214 RepID=UPI002FDECD40